MFTIPTAAHVTSIPQLTISGQIKPLLQPLTLHGSSWLTLPWLVIGWFAAVGIANGGGGQWIVLLCLSMLCALKQSSTVAELSGVTLFFRDGLLGQYAQTIPCASIHTLWLKQNTLMRLINVGRVGMTTYEGKTYLSPLIQQPGTLKNAIIELAANRKPLWLPSDQQIILNDSF